MLEHLNYYLQKNMCNSKNSRFQNLLQFQKKKGIYESSFQKKMGDLNPRGRKKRLQRHWQKKKDGCIDRTYLHGTYWELIQCR